MKKIILLLTVVFFASSCSKNEYIVMVEQPSNYLLDNLNLEIIIDKNKVSDIALKGTNVTPSFVTTKVIILSPYIDKKGKVNIGILKQKEKFIFQ